MKRLKLSISNIILIIICLIVLITVLVLNAVNSKSLVSLRESIDTLEFQNPSIGLLQETDKHLSIAENNYRIYLTNNDTVFRNAFLNELSQIQLDLQQISFGPDSADVNQIIRGLGKKLELADMISQLKLIADSVTIRSKSIDRKRTTKNTDHLKVKKIDKSIVESFVVNRLDTLNGATLHDSKGQVDKSKDVKAIDSFSKETILDSSIIQLSDEIKKFYQGSVDEEMNMRMKLNEGEKILAETNLTIISQIDTALESLLQKEVTARKVHLANALQKASQARESVARFSYGSLGIIILIIVLLLFNIYRLIKYESQLIEARETAEKMTLTKSRFLSNMSHEIRSPLTSIMGFTDIIVRMETDPEKKKYLQAIKASSDHLLHTVNNVLDFSKLDAGKLQLEAFPFQLKEAIFEVTFAFSAAAAEKGITISEEIGLPEELIVIGDRFRLKQILYNLISNAIKFTDKGTIVITADASFKTDTQADISIQVADSGMGIPSSQLSNIFEEFSQVSSSAKINESRRAIRGTGLGLPISKMLAELQGGTIQVSSKLNEGSVFKVLLMYPVQNRPIKTEIIPIVLETKKLDQLFVDKKALVIEDNEMNAMLLGLLLKKQQLPFDLAKDGLAGWELFNENKYDIILTDINVPKMTGDELARAIKNHPDGNTSIPIIALTATILQDDLDDFRKAGISDILVKPFKETDLNEMLLKHLYPTP